MLSFYLTCPILYWFLKINFAVFHQHKKCTYNYKITQIVKSGISYQLLLFKGAWFSSRWDQTEQMFNEIDLRMAILFLFAIKILGCWILKWHDLWGEGIPYPALNSVRAEICISFGQWWTTNTPWTWGANPLGTKVTKNKRPFQRDQEEELEEPRGLVFLVLARILWGDWIPSEVSVDFSWLLEDTK